MKKAFRVKKEADFQKVFHQGKSKANRQFVVYYLERPEQEHFRVGFSVGKKIGNAVMRNSVKRKMRAAIQELGPQIRPELDFIIIARKPVSEMTQAEIKKSLGHVMRLSSIFE